MSSYDHLGRSFRGTSSITSRKYSNNQVYQLHSRNSKRAQSFALSRSKSNARSFQDIGLPGLSLACDTKAGVIKRTTWGILWLLSLSCCIIQCTNCIRYFVDSPTHVNIKYDLNDSMDIPYVTICPANPSFKNPSISPILLKERFGNLTYTRPYDLLLKSNMTVDELWNISSFESWNKTVGVNTINHLMDGFEMSPEEVEERTLLTIHGSCLTFKTKTLLKCMGTQTGLNVMAIGENPYPNSSFSYFMGVVHSEAEIPYIRYVGTIEKGFYVMYKQFTTVAIGAQQLIQVNTRRKPCQSEDEYIHCLVRCIETKILAASTASACRLPFMETMDSTIRTCVSADDFLNMYTATDFSLRETSEVTCGCIEPCRKLQYWEDYFLKDALKDDNLFDFLVIMPHCHIEVIEEELSYGYVAFISDIGGALGLLLGLSILNIVELLEVILSKIVFLKHVGHFRN